MANKIIAVCLLSVSLIWMAATVRADAPVFYAADGAAIRGYDVVTYFTAEKPQPGKPDIAVMWKGAVWQFASSENREMFEANPRAFAPQYGGYCAYGVAKGLVLHTDPTVFQVRNGKLYLIHSQAVWGKWVQDIPGNITAANANWPEVLTYE